MRIGAFLIPLLLHCASGGVPAGDLVSDKMVANRGEIRIMWYNVENLFHPENDTIPGDDEFTPDGVRRWTYARYRKKLTAISKVIVAAGEWDPPDLLGLCEVEDARVLEDLIQHPILAPYHYHYIHQDSPDRRGMDVACLFRVKRIQPVGWEVIKSEYSRGNEGTRDIVHFWGSWGQHDSLDIFLVHLISKYGGAGATAGVRKRQVTQLVRLADSVHGGRKSSLTILAGDFNDSMEGYSLVPIREGHLGDDTLVRVHMDGPLGTYKYQGDWNQIDRFLVGGQLATYSIRGSILTLPVLLSHDAIFGGVIPHRTYVGYLYQGGISDHLPILLDITGGLRSSHSER